MQQSKVFDKFMEEETAGPSREGNELHTRRSTSSDSLLFNKMKPIKATGPTKKQIIKNEKNIVEEMINISSSLCVLPQIEETCNWMANALETMAIATEK